MACYYIYDFGLKFVDPFYTFDNLSKNFNWCFETNK